MEARVDSPRFQRSRRTVDTTRSDRALLIVALLTALPALPWADPGRSVRPAAAEPLLRHALAVQERSYAAGDWRVATTQSLLGDVCTRLSRFAEAEPYLLRASEVLEVTPGSESSESMEAREARDNLARLAALYEAWGRPAKAAAYRSPR